MTHTRRHVAAVLLVVMALLVAHAASVSAEDSPAFFAGKATLDGPMLARALRGPMRDTEEVFFAVRGHAGDHYYSPFGYWLTNPDRTLYAKGPTALCALNLRTGRLRSLLQDEDGAIRYPHLRHDGERIVFSYRKTGSENHHLYDIRPDGTDLRQLTSGDWDDMDPCYLPNGDIVFASSRCHCWVGCWVTPVAVLYRCGPNGENIERLSANVEHESAPWVMPDGRVVFTRWEYTERHLTAFHHLWTVNPDGTGAMAYYGNSRTKYDIQGAPERTGKRSRSWLFIDAKPIPGTDDVVAIANRRHGNARRSGMIVRIDPEGGPDKQGAMTCLSPEVEGQEWRWQDPYPLSEDLYIACTMNEMGLVDSEGNYEKLYEIPDTNGWRGLRIGEPAPLRPRMREPIMVDRVDPDRTTGTFVLQDVSIGRSMEGVDRGDVKKLLILELLPWAMKGDWSKDNLGSPSRNVWTHTGVIGTVPVEPDGSAHFRAPADRALFFVCLDEDDECIKRMQSMVQVRPGETVSCVGCHEKRVHAPPADKRHVLQALERPPSNVQKIEGVAHRVDFNRDIQPILDKKCVKCHNRDKRAGGISLQDDRGPTFSHSYSYLIEHVGNVYGSSHGDTPPYRTGSGSARLYHRLKSGHKDVELTEVEMNKLRLWIDTGATWTGRYGAMDSSRLFVNAGWAADRYQGERPQITMSWQITEQGCVSCHLHPRAYERMKQRAKDGPIKWPTEDTWYNLDHPEKSMMLLAPLSEEAGGLGICDDIPGITQSAPVFHSKNDPRWQQLRADMKATAATFREITTFERPGFIPSPHYIREMKRAGALPRDWQPGDPIDLFEVERRYLQKWWPKGRPRAEAN